MTDQEQRIAEQATADLARYRKAIDDLNRSTDRDTIFGAWTTRTVTPAEALALWKPRD